MTEEPPGHAERDTQETSPQTGGGIEPEEVDAQAGERSDQDNDDEEA